jgi:hypothetical protein
MHCCLCQTPSPTPDTGFPESATQWATAPFELAATQVAVAEGRQAGGPGQGYLRTTSFCVCPACFRSHVIPWFRRAGAKPDVEQHDL